MNSAFPDINLNIDDIISNWAGVRPLIHEDGKSPSELSRKDEIFISDSGLIAIAGGKLTGYRKMAERVVDIVSEKIRAQENISLKPCQTDNIYFTNEPLKNSEAVNKYIQEIEMKTTALKLDNYFSWYLVTNYGKAAQEILDKVKDFDNEAEIALTRAELAYCLEHEMVYTIADFYVRRTGRLYFEIQNIAASKSYIIEDLSNYFEWSPDYKAQQVAAFEEEYKDATTYYDKEF